MFLLLGRKPNFCFLSRIIMAMAFLSVAKYKQNKHTKCVRLFLPSFTKRFFLSTSMHFGVSCSVLCSNLRTWNKCKLFYSVKDWKSMQGLVCFSYREGTIYWHKWQKCSDINHGKPLTLNTVEVKDDIHVHVRHSTAVALFGFELNYGMIIWFTDFIS